MPELSNLTLQNPRFQTMFHFDETLEMRQYPSLVWVGGFYAMTKILENYIPFQDGQFHSHRVEITVKRGEEQLPSFLDFYLYENTENVGIGMVIYNRLRRVDDKRTLIYKHIMEVKTILDKDLAKWIDNQNETEYTITQFFKFKYNNPAWGSLARYCNNIEDFFFASQSFFRRIDHFPVAFQREFAIFKARLHGYAQTRFCSKNQYGFCP